jgi:transcription initiation factor TFIIIB Brf1 subunit/transcription initiation factor TFIIB
MQTPIIYSTCTNNNNSGQMLITDPESGKIICSNCGMVMLDNIEENRPAWRTFTTTTDELTNQGRSRIVVSTSLAGHEMGLPTIIGKTDRGASIFRVGVLHNISCFR